MDRNTPFYMRRNGQHRGKRMKDVQVGRIARHWVATIMLLHSTNTGARCQRDVICDRQGMYHWAHLPQGFERVVGLPREECPEFSSRRQRRSAEVPLTVWTQAVRRDSC